MNNNMGMKMPMFASANQQQVSSPYICFGATRQHFDAIVMRCRNDSDSRLPKFKLISSYHVC